MSNFAACFTNGTAVSALCHTPFLVAKQIQSSPLNKLYTPSAILSFQMYTLLFNRFTFLCFSNCFYGLCMYLFSLWAAIFNKVIVIIYAYLL